MAKKLILTEEQHAVIINEILKETITKIESNERLNEGFWDSVKYGLSKLGRYKANGKIFGKGKIDQEAGRKIQQIIDKEGNELIKNLDAKIKEENPEFPNGKNPQQFLKSVMEIAAVYDSLVAATKKSPQEEGYMPIDAANGIITDLREYTKKFLDTDLAAVYSGFDESEGKMDDNDLMNEEYELDEEQMCGIDEYFGLTEALPKRTGNSQVSKTNQDPQVSGKASSGNYNPTSDMEDIDYEDIQDNPSLDSKDVRSQLQAKRGDGEDFDSTRMDTLKSNKLPLILAGTGAALGALGWMAQTEWFKNWLETVLGGGDKIIRTPAITQDITGGPDDKQGFVHWASKLMGKDIKTGADMQQFVDKFGSENVSHMFDGNGGGDSMGQMQKLQQLISSNPQASMGDLFNKADQTFGSMSGGQNLFGVSSSAKFFATIVVKQATKTLVKGAGTALAGKLIGLGPVLAGVGIGLLATGAAVKLVRMKGQKSSRAATLNALYQSMRGLEGGVGLIPATTGDETGNDISTAVDTGIDTGVDTGTDVDTGVDIGVDTVNGVDTGKQKTTKTDNSADGAMNDDLYNSLRNLFGFIVNSEKKFGKGPKNTLAEALLDEEMLDEAKYFRDKALVKYLNKNVSPTRVVEFQNLLNRVEQLRNKIRNLKPTGDKVFDQFLERFRQNPISMTDFNKMFNIVTVNQQAYQNMANFINDIFKTIYTGKYKQSGLIDKLGGIGKMNEADPNAARTQFEKNAQDRKKFKKHLLQFLDDSIALFQYMVKLRKQAAASGKQTKTKQPKQNVSAAPRQKAAASQTSSEPQADDKGQYSLGLNENHKLMEELKRIKKIMLS
jgi:hypothetical protein